MKRAQIDLKLRLYAMYSRQIRTPSNRCMRLHGDGAPFNCARVVSLILKISRPSILQVIVSKAIQSPFTFLVADEVLRSDNLKALYGHLTVLFIVF